mmetsp:Transcript_2322/g.5363  ORF Transcript_2322/g.5363 Transcript_2322/m.5363 type:complete len:737 (-) Transcript_2322:599-2809(-)
MQSSYLNQEEEEEELLQQQQQQQLHWTTHQHANSRLLQQSSSESLDKYYEDLSSATESPMTEGEYKSQSTIPPVKSPSSTSSYSASSTNQDGITEAPRRETHEVGEDDYKSACGVTSYDAFMHFVKFTTLDQSKCDASGILSRACFETWLKTRKGIPVMPEDSFRRTITAHVTGTKKRRPFPAAVETHLLELLRERRVWPCFDGYRSLQKDQSHKPLLIGKSGFRAKGFHEQSKVRDTPTLDKPPRELPQGFAVTDPSLPTERVSRNSHAPIPGSSTNSSSTFAYASAPPPSNTYASLAPLSHHTTSQHHQNAPMSSTSSLASSAGNVQRPQTGGMPNVEIESMIDPSYNLQYPTLPTSQGSLAHAKKGFAADRDFENEYFQSSSFHDNNNAGANSSHRVSEASDDEEAELLKYLFETDAGSLEENRSYNIRPRRNPSLENLHSMAETAAVVQRHPAYTKNPRVAQDLLSVASECGDAVENLIRRAFGGCEHNEFVESVRRAWEEEPQMLMYVMRLFSVEPEEFVTSLQGRNSLSITPSSDRFRFAFDIHEMSHSLRASVVRIICHTLSPDSIRSFVKLDANQNLLRQTFTWRHQLSVPVQEMGLDPRLGHGFRFPHATGMDFDTSRPIGHAAFDAITGQYFQADPTAAIILHGDVVGKCNYHLAPSPFFYWTAFRETAPLIVMYQRVLQQNYSIRVDGTPFICRSLFKYRNGRIYSTFQDVTHLYPDLIHLPITN